MWLSVISWWGECVIHTVLYVSCHCHSTTLRFPDVIFSTTRVMASRRAWCGNMPKRGRAHPNIRQPETSRPVNFEQVPQAPTWPTMSIAFRPPFLPLCLWQASLLDARFREYAWEKNWCFYRAYVRLFMQNSWQVALSPWLIKNQNLWEVDGWIWLMGLMAVRGDAKISITQIFQPTRNIEGLKPPRTHAHVYRNNPVPLRGRPYLSRICPLICAARLHLVAMATGTMLSINILLGCQAKSEKL